MRTIVAAGLCTSLLMGCSINLVVDGTSPPPTSTPGRVHPGTVDQPGTAVTIPASSTTGFDPTEVEPLSEWWSNGSQLLNLRPNGAYRLYADLNRYRAPVERGRWWRQTYATLWVQPYDVLTHQSTRVTLDKPGGAYELAFRQLPPMTPLDGAPPVVEDRLIGSWTGTPGRLTLDHRLRYRFAPPPADASTPAALAGQQGRWVVEDDYLILKPDSAAVQHTVVRIGDEDGRLFLESDAGTMRRE